MKTYLMVGLVASLGAGAAWADLKPDIIDCDAKKVARNAAMEATVGVHGGCDAGKMADNARDDVVDGAKDAVDDVKPDLNNKPLQNDHHDGKLRKNKD